MAEQQNPFESKLFRSLVGLSGGVAAAVIGILFFEGTTRLLILGIGVLDVLVTPYILKRVAEQQREETEAGV